MSNSNHFPISLRAWPEKDDRSTALTTLIQRINHERGGFRNVTEESLKEEIDRKTETVVTNHNADDEHEDMNGEELDESEDEEDPAKELVKTKGEMIARLESAHWASLQALDFVSMLLSSHNPVQASQTISPTTKDLVGLGTIGADRLSEPRVTLAQRDDSLNIAQSWKFQSVAENADAIIKSADKLKNETDAESNYWQNVVDISSKGWSVCELPWESQTLGVRFGFRDSSDSFVSRNIAALRRDDNGGVILDHSLNETTSKRFRVRIEHDRRTTGQYCSSDIIHEDASLHDLVLQARNAIFEQELWQELQREGRSLYGQGVRCDANEIRYQFSKDHEIVLDVAAIDGLNDPLKSMNDDHNSLATMMWFSLHVSLNQAHREKYRRRTQKPPPIGAGKTPNPAYPLLRQIIAQLKHLDIIGILDDYFQPLSAALISMGVTNTAASHTTTNISADSPNAVVASINTMETSFELPLISDSMLSTSLAIKTRCIMFPVIETRFQLAPSNELAKLCPAPSAPSLHEMLQYIAWATCCAIANHIVTGQGSSWKRSPNPTVVRREATDLGCGGREISLDVEFGDTSAQSHEHLGQARQVTAKIRMSCKTAESWATASQAQGTDASSSYVWPSQASQSTGTLDDVLRTIGDAILEEERDDGKS